MDDEIIYSWCFNFVNCYDLTSSTTIIVWVKNLESSSSLKSLQSRLPNIFAFLVFAARMKSQHVHSYG